MIKSRYICHKLLRSCKYCENAVLGQYNRGVSNQRRALYVNATINAGHSHWENIRHIKSAKDAARSKVFSGLAMRISAAIKVGGSNDPRKNSELAKVLKVCKEQNMPRATIERSLAAKHHDNQEFVYGVSGPGGSSLVVVCQSNVPKVAKRMMNNALTRSQFDGDLDQQATKQFARKWIILADVGSKELSEDEATEIALTVGAEDVKVLSGEEGHILEFICDVKGHSEVEKAVQEDESINIVSSKPEYLPNMQICLSESDLTAIEIFVSALRRVSDKPEYIFTLTDIYHNITNIDSPI